MKGKDIAKFLKQKVAGAPRGQHKGPIVAGPPGYRKCNRCTTMYAEKGRTIGVPVRRWRAHKAAHQDGTVASPTMAL